MAVKVEAGVDQATDEEAGVARLTPRPLSAQVSAQMARHPRKDTGPELALRRLLFARGLRYRLQMRVPGVARRTIDIAFPGRKVAVFLDGCFWHGCPDHGMLPRNNLEWWRDKLDSNRRRDAETAEHLVALGWEVMRFWAHENPAAAAEEVAARLAVLRTVRSQRQEPS